MSFEITDNTKKYLLNEARRVIEDSLGIKSAQKKAVCDEDLTSLRAGAFVSLHKKGDLRGCVGRIVSDLPIDETVRQMALAAAFQDSRFLPLNTDELQDTDIEITILSPLKSTSIEEIEVGRDGLLMEYMGYHGVLLPQVPVEYGWDRDEFLNHLCIKAGLPDDVWKKCKINLYSFEGLVFNENL